MLLDKAISAHGGKELWDKVSSLTVKLQIGGNILATRFKSPFIRHLTVEISCLEVKTVISPFSSLGIRGIFTDKYVQIEQENGSVIRKKTLVELFNGKAKLPTIWTDLHLLYFFGYALWNYLMTPFLFSWPGFRCEETGIWQEKDGSILHKLEVTFPSNIPSHCKKQVFYFNDLGLLCRLDYTAEIFSSFTRGAHYCLDHKEFGGLVFPTSRKVFPLLPNGYPLKLFTVMNGQIDSISINLK